MTTENGGAVFGFSLPSDRKIETHRAEWLQEQKSASGVNAENCRPSPKPPK